MRSYDRVAILGVIGLVAVLGILRGPRGFDDSSRDTAPGVTAAGISEHGIRRFEAIDALALIVHVAQKLRMLDRDWVQKELDLSAAQIEGIGSLTADARSALAGIQSAIGDQRAAQTRTKWLPAAERYEKNLRQLLTPGQNRRLYQMVLREQRGAIVLLVPGVSEHLELTQTQRNKIARMVAETQEALDHGGTGPLGLAALALKVRKARGRAMNLLSPDQRAKWQALAAGSF